MADDDDLAWDDMDEEDFVVETQNKLNVSGGAVANDNDKFKGEDEEDEKPAASPSTAGSSAKKKKKTPIRTGNESLVDSTKKPTSNGAGGGEPMSREEQRRRQLEADAQNAADLFDMNEDLDKFIPEDAKEYAQYGWKVARKYLIKYERDGADYHLLLKELLRTALGDMSSADVKDIESCVVALRNEALKKEKEKSGKSKKAKKREQLNAGRSGGSAGLDDADYDYDYDEDDYDFM